MSDELKRIKKQEPNVKLGALILGIWKRRIIRKAVKNGFYSLQPLHQFVTKKFIMKAHKKHLKINPWTLDSKTRLKKLLDWGIDGIITNDIELVKKVLNRK